MHFNDSKISNIE